MLIATAYIFSRDRPDAPGDEIDLMREEWPGRKERFTIGPQPSGPGAFIAQEATRILKISALTGTDPNDIMSGILSLYGWLIQEWLAQ